MPGWLLLHVYVLVDFLHFVGVLFHSDVFEYVTFCCGLLHFMCVAGGAVVSSICKRIFVRRESLLGGLRPKVRRTFGNFNVPLRIFCQIWWNTYLSLRIHFQQPFLATMGCNGIIIDYMCIHFLSIAVRVKYILSETRVEAVNGKFRSSFCTCIYLFGLVSTCMWTKSFKVFRRIWA